MNLELTRDFELKTSFNIDKTNMFFRSSVETEVYQSNGYHPPNEVLEFKMNKQRTCLLFCNFFLKEFYTDSGEKLDYSPKFVQDLYILISQNNFQIVPYVFNNKSHPTYKEFQFPTSFFYNTNFECVETQIPLNFTSSNDVMWRLEIETKEYPNSEQICRVSNLISKRFNVRNMLHNELFHFYNSTARIDFDLPELKLVSNISYFLSEGNVFIPIASESPITIFVNTWDEEHGATFYYDDKNNKLTLG